MSEEKPWEDAKTTKELNKILRPRTADRMSMAETPESPPKNQNQRDPAAELPVAEAERLEKRNRTISRHVGGGLGGRK